MSKIDLERIENWHNVSSEELREMITALREARSLLIQFSEYNQPKEGYIALSREALASLNEKFDFGDGE